LGEPWPRDAPCCYRGLVSVFYWSAMPDTTADVTFPGLVDSEQIGASVGHM
jgi:hypothetical protein